MSRARYGLRLGAAYTIAAAVLRPVVLLFSRTDWHGAQNLAGDGGIIVVANHLSPADPITLAHFLYDNGRPPRYLAKESVFAVPLIGRLLRGAGQIPVRRFTGSASEVLGDAADALRRGECVVIYPEGTITKDPALWPMRGKTGAGRLWWDTRAPVVPVAQWGVQTIVGRDGVHLLPPRTSHVVAGPPLDLSRFADQEPTTEVMRAIADEVTAALRALVGQLRDEQPPADVLDWDAVRAGRVPPPPGVRVPARHRPTAVASAPAPTAPAPTAPAPAPTPAADATSAAAPAHGRPPGAAPVAPSGLTDRVAS